MPQLPLPEILKGDEKVLQIRRCCVPLLGEEIWDRVDIHGGPKSLRSSESSLLSWPGSSILRRWYSKGGEGRGGEAGCQFAFVVVKIRGSRYLELELRFRYGMVPSLACCGRLQSNKDSSFTLLFAHPTSIEEEPRRDHAEGVQSVEFDPSSDCPADHPQPRPFQTEHL